MNWQELRQNNKIFDHLDAVWSAEQAMPLWFLDASKTWLNGQDAFRNFVGGCKAVHGLFDAERLMMCIYYETQPHPRDIMIHLSVMAKAPAEIFVEKCTELRDETFHAGARTIRAWVLTRNRALMRLIGEIGFRSTGLKADHGTSRGRTLRWEMMEVVRG